MTARSLRPFRYRTFSLFFAGSVVSNVGTIMESVALGYYVQQRTGQATWNGIVAALGFLPTAVLAPVGGALADRISRRKLLLIANGAAAVCAALMTFMVATNRGAPAVIALISFGAGASNALGWPALQSLLGELVPPEDLVAAVGLSAAQWNLARVIGPAVAALVISVGSVTWALAVNTASFFVVLAVFAVLPFAHRPKPQHHERVFASIQLGWAYVRRQPTLWSAFRLQWLNCLLGSAYIGLVPAVAAKVFHGGEGMTAALSTAMGVGAVGASFGFGSLVAAAGPRRVMIGATVGLPVATVFYGLAPVPILAMVAVALWRFAISARCCQRRLRARQLPPPNFGGGRSLRTRWASECSFLLPSFCKALSATSSVCAGPSLRSDSPWRPFSSA